MKAKGAYDYRGAYDYGGPMTRVGLVRGGLGLGGA